MTEQVTDNTPAYDMSIHHNPDAAAWAKFYCETFPDADEGLMQGWFANAMMAMHDHLMQKHEWNARLATASTPALVEEEWLRGDWYEKWEDATENADDGLMATLEALRGRVERTILAALTTPTPAQPAWNTNMDEAPPEGVDIWCAGRRWADCEKVEGGWVSGSSQDVPTHSYPLVAWMPLPTPPQETE